MDADVVIVGAGPVGLMLAGELCLAGVRPLVLERQPRLRETPKASGFNGQIVDLAGQVKLVKVNVDTSPQVSQRSESRPSRPCWSCAAGRWPPGRPARSRWPPCGPGSTTRSPPLAEHGCRTSAFRVSAMAGFGRAVVRLRRRGAVPGLLVGVRDL